MRRFSVNIVFQVALISALSVAVLVAALVWSARLRRGLSVPHEARRVLVAVERACWAALRRRATSLPWATGGTLTIILLAQSAIRATPGSASISLSLLGSVVTLALGLLAGFAVALLCGYLVRGRSFFSVGSAAISINRCLTATLSSAAVLAIAADVLGILSTVGVHGLLWLLARGLSDATAPDGASMLTAMRAAPYFGVGATLAALGLGQTGAACIAATKLTGPSAFECRTGLPAMDPRNPSVLVLAVANQLGNVVPRVLDSFIGGSLVTTISLQLVYIAPRLGWSSGAATIAMLPLLVRCFGLLASLFGLVTLRATEHEELASAFDRSQLVAHVVLASALAGITVWLIGAVSLQVAMAAIVGLLLTPALGRLRTFMLARARIPRPLPDESIPHGAVVSADVLSAALRFLLWPTLLYPCGLAMFAWWFVRTSTSPVEVGAAVLLGLAAPSSLAAYNLAVGLGRDFEAVGVLSAGVGRITLTADSSHRLRRIADAAERVASSTDPALSDAGALLCALAAIVCQVSHGRTVPTGPPTVMLLGLTVWVFLPGLLATIASLRIGSRTARTQVHEVDRQLRGMRRDGAQVLVPEDFVPSYRSCVELLARDSANGRLVFAVLGLALPLLVVLLGSMAENTPGLAALGLASYAAIAAAAGLFAAHIGHAAAVASSLANRGGAPSWLSASPPAVSVSEPLRLVEYLGQSLGVSAPLLTKAVALATLAFSALLI